MDSAFYEFYILLSLLLFLPDRQEIQLRSVNLYFLIVFLFPYIGLFSPMISREDMKKVIKKMDGFSKHSLFLTLFLDTFKVRSNY